MGSILANPASPRPSLGEMQCSASSRLSLLDRPAGGKTCSQNRYDRRISTMHPPTRRLSVLLGLIALGLFLTPTPTPAPAADIEPAHAENDVYGALQRDGL